jgi:hypothetical protein
MEIKCKLCLELGPSSQSHITPKSLLNNVYLHSNIKGKPSKRHLGGIYDRNILCQSCEAKYMKWDSYGKLFLDNPLKHQEALALYQNNEIIGYELFQVDYKKLKLFTLSLLWRMHTTQHENFKEVNLGHHINRVRTLILNQYPSNDMEFAIILGKFNYDKKFMPFHISPFRRKIEGINYYIIHIYGYTFYIKVDQQTRLTTSQEIRLRENGYLFLFTRDFETSKEKSYLINLLKNNQ